MDKIMGLFRPEKATTEQTLKLDDVIVDNDLNPREGALDQDVVLDYSAHVDELPPMTAFDVQGFYFLVGGFHRYAAHRLAQRAEGRFIVHQGSREEAKEFADLDNLRNGLRLNRAERRRVIERQLKRHPEWADARLALACCTTDKTVRSVREALEQTSEIPRLDVLVGGDGIERPRTVSRPVREETPDDRQPTFESTQPIAPALLQPVEEIEAQIVTDPAAGPAPWEMSAEQAAAGLARLEADLKAAGHTTPLTDAVMSLSEEDKDIAINNPVIYEAMGREQVAVGLAEDDAGESLVEEPAEMAATAPPLPPVQVAPPPAPLPPPPPVITDAAWVLAISIRAGNWPPLITITHGTEQRAAMPAEIAERVHELIRAKTEQAVPAEAEQTEIPVATPDWLIAK